MAARKLNPQQEAFCQLYAKGGQTAQQCAIDAGYAPKSARITASRMLTLPRVSARIDELREASNTKNTLTRQEIREIRAEIARDSDSNRKERMEAIRDEEKAMGWNAPDKVEHDHKVRITWGG